MSEVFQIQLLMSVVSVLFEFGRQAARASGAESEATVQRHLLRQATQMQDGALLRSCLKEMGRQVREGDPDQAWGGPGLVEFQAADSQGRPWLAFARDSQTGSYAIYSHDPAYAQDDLPAEIRLSEVDPGETLGLLAQAYGYTRSLQSLLEAGYSVKGDPEERLDGSQVRILERIDPQTGEVHTVKLVFQREGGRTSILTDSRREDGSHGVCPDLDDLLHGMGLREYERWASPAAEQARRSHERSKSQAASRRTSEEDMPREQKRRGRGEA